MSKRLPKATLSTLSDIHRESVGMTIDLKAERVEEESSDSVASASTAVTTRLRQPVDAELRRAQAENIIERYTTYSALGGCIPLFIFDALSVSLIVFRMVRALAEHYDLPFHQDQVKACVAALIGGLASPSLGNATTHLLSKIIPGAWIIGTAASSAAAAAYTRYAGHAFVEHFESGGTALDLDIAKIRAVFKKQTAAC